MSGPAKRKPTVFDEEYVRDVSEFVYRLLLEQDNRAGAVERMLQKDADGGTKLRRRAEVYDRITRAYLRAREEGVLR